MPRISWFQILRLLLASDNKTSAYTFTQNDFAVYADASGGSFSVKLPLSPINGEIHNLIKIDSSANMVTLDGNGKNINGVATKTISTQYTSYMVQYNITADAWFII